MQDAIPHAPESVTGEEGVDRHSDGRESDDRDNRDKARDSSRDRKRSHHSHSRDRDRRRSRRRSRSGSRSRGRDRDRRSSRKKRRKSRDSDDDSAGENSTPAGLPAGMPSLVEIMKANPTMSMAELMGKITSGGVVPGAPLTMDSASTKPARELYVGGLPPGVPPTQLQEFVSAAMQQMNLNTQPGSSVVNTWLSSDNHYAFCEFRSVEEANNGMMLNGISFLGQALRVGRPKNYDGPAITPIPGQAALGGGLGGASQTSILMVLNLPKYLNGENTKELLRSFGELDTFNLMKDEKGESLGSALFEYKDKANTVKALQGLSGIALGEAKLQVTYAPATPGLKLKSADAPDDDPADNLIDNGPADAAPDEQNVGEPGQIIQLGNMISENREELKDDEEYADVVDDVREEMENFGDVLALEIPRPSEGKEDAVGHIYVKYASIESAAKALKAMGNRSFGGNLVKCTYMPGEDFDRLFPSTSAPTASPSTGAPTAPNSSLELD